jgi:hypothetical protein
LVTEVECTHNRAIFGDSVSIEVSVSLLSETENKYPCTLLWYKGCVTVDTKAFTPAPSEANAL